jgi:hypothetical protein
LHAGDFHFRFQNCLFADETMRYQITTCGNLQLAAPVLARTERFSPEY